MIREESDKEYIMQIEHNYQNELSKIKDEKDLIVAQSDRFAHTLQDLKQDYDFKTS
jgi:hypothetical protein